jgi:hypothetical protein
MSETTSPVPERLQFLETRRRDRWWSAPVATGAGLLAFLVYATWAALQGDHYIAGPYLSPFYSPLLQPEWWPLSPAFLILWAPGGFRLTCYYYRKAYYRALFLTPPACAVGGKPQRYRGERAILLFQNLHRYFLYPSLALVVILSIDAIHAFAFDDGIGLGFGTLVLLLNAFFLLAFTFGCNSLRHLVGGNVDCYSCVAFGKQRHRAWRLVSWFNRDHMLWAWVSLFWVAFADLYVRLVSMGIVTDLRLL